MHFATAGHASPEFVGCSQNSLDVSSTAKDFRAQEFPITQCGPSVFTATAGHTSPANLFSELTAKDFNAQE
eukprot:7039671-Karenia_brevis.AAC.1